MLFGVINVDKPKELTSREVVNQIVRCCPRKTKVGHAGTLDPMATGVLVVAVGPATRLIQFAQAMPKTYVGDFKLGFTSDTEDATGNVVKLANSPVPNREQLLTAIHKFRGNIVQTPPQFSAVKVNGQRAYKTARKGEVVEIAARPATIHAIRLVEFEYPNFKLEVECGKGTYIRTLGRDISKTFGSDAIMTSLIRTRIGPFDIASSDALYQINNDSVAQKVLSPSQMVSHLKSVSLNDAEIRNLVHGKLLDDTRWDDAARNSNQLAAYSKDGQLLAVLKKKSESQFGTIVNFAPLLSGL